MCLLFVATCLLVFLYIYFHFPEKAIADSFDAISSFLIGHLFL
jgi:hypothetical protein